MDDIKNADKIIGLTPKQIDIYKGLRSIGEEIPSFFLDGIKILKAADLETKSYLLAHIAREIEGGLRNILVSEQKTVKKCKECGKSISKTNHIDSICKALGVKKEDQFAKRWHKTAKRFHKYAHRHGSWKTPRKKSEFEPLWNEFEKILFQLVGTYYNLLDRVDRILQYEKPSDEIIGTLSNLLKVEARYSYFFKNLDSQDWLIPLKENGYFKPENNPKPLEVPDQPGYYRIPFWNALNYLEKIANKNLDVPTEETTNALIEIVNSIINYRDEKGERIDNHLTDRTILKIMCTFPIEKIEKQHIEFARSALKSKWGTAFIAKEISETVLSRFVKDEAKNLVVDLLDVILDYQKLEQQFGDKYISVMDNYWLYETLKKHKTGIAHLCGIDAAEIALNKIKTILQDNKTQFHYASIPTIEDSPQTRFPDRYEYQMVHFVRDIFELSDSNQTRKKIEDLCKEEHSIFKRIAIHIINYNYEDLKDLFWNWPRNPLDEGPLAHEIYELLKTNCLTFSEKQIEKILEWIESKDYYIPDELKNDEEQSEKIKAYYKREWLSTLLETQNPKVIKMNEKYEAINPTEIQRPIYSTWIETRTGDISPIKPEELCTKSNVELAEYLNNFNEEGGWKSPTKTGLSDAFKTCVASNPEKFSKDLEPFLGITRMYQHSLLRGLLEAWNAKKVFDWTEILSFILQIIETDIFWKEEYGKYENYRSQIISVSSNLIEEGTKDDSTAFDPKLLPEAEKILLILSEKTKSDLLEIDNPVMDVLNSTKGKILSAMINYSLRYARLYKKDTEDKWVDSIRNKFDKQFDKEIEPSLEFIVTLGMYLPNLFYLDKKWVIDNISKIFPKTNNTQWKAAFTGYLSYYKLTNEEIYLLLKKTNHYAKALKTDFEDEFIEKNLVYHICKGYLEEWDELSDENSLISKLIETKNTTHLSEIINYFWMQRESLSDKKKARIKPLWSSLFKVVFQHKDSPEYQKILSKLSFWLSLVDEIDDEVFEWSKASARFIQMNFDAPFLIEYLLKHVVVEQEKVAKIYLEMLDSGIYPDYDQSHIEKIVRILSEKGQREHADRISNMYGERGLDFLRVLYENQKETSNHEKSEGREKTE